MAEHLLRHALNAEPAPLRNLKVSSFGTGAYPGCSASKNAVHVLSKVKLNLKKHRSQSMHEIDLSNALACFCMTSAHRDVLLCTAHIDPSRVFLVRQWVEDPPSDIPDPFGSDVRDYAHCRDAIVEAIPSILDFLRCSQGMNLNTE